MGNRQSAESRKKVGVSGNKIVDSNIGESGDKVNYFDMLPDGIITDMVSYTTPLDACRLALVSSGFRLIADSDVVWERFFPSDYQQLISRAVPDDHVRVHVLFTFSPKKDLYRFLCDHPLIIDNGALSFSLEKQTGKKCYMIAASELEIALGDNPMHWMCFADSESRFGTVRGLTHVCWLEINGKISASFLSPDTAYATFLVYKIPVVLFGFEDNPIEISVGIIGDESIKRTVYLRRMFGSVQCSTRPMIRKDGWTYIKLAEYYNRDGENRELEISLKEVTNLNWKGGLHIQGIEIRPLT